MAILITGTVVCHSQPSDVAGLAVFSPVAPLDCAPYIRNGGFTAGQVSRVLKMTRC